MNYGKFRPGLPQPLTLTAMVSSSSADSDDKKKQLEDFIIHRYEQTGYSLLNITAYSLCFLIIDFLLLLLTILGNTLILVALKLNRTLRKIKGFILIGNLAFRDLLMGLFFLPLDISLHLKHSLFENGTFCLCYHSVLYALILSSVFNLLLLSMERLHAVHRPFEHMKNFTSQRLVILICLSWITALSIGLIPTFGWKTLPVQTDTNCRKSMTFSKRYRIIMNSFLVVAIAVCAVCFYVVCRIAFRKINESNHYEMGNAEVQSRMVILKRDIHLTKVLVLVSGLFIICWAPYCDVSFVPNLSPTMSCVRNFLSSLGVLNSCLNWIVYGARNREFRAAFRDILTRRCWRTEMNFYSN